MKRIMNEQQIIDAMWGATLLGGGGGGTMEGGLRLVEMYHSNHPGKPLEATLIDADEMEPGKLAVTVSSMGAPSAIKDTDITPHATYAYEAVQRMAAKMDPPQDLAYLLSVELGGYTTAIPLVLAAILDVPIMDADGTGRAVPTLDTALSHINGCDTTPYVLTDGHGNEVVITTKNPRDAVLAESIARSVCVHFGMNCGTAGVTATPDMLRESFPEGTITLCEKVGHILRQQAGTGTDVYSLIQQQGVAASRMLCAGTVRTIETKRDGGFDHGRITLDTADGVWYTYYQNETLLITNGDTPVMTVPEIICYYGRQDGVPLTNADLREGMEIAVGAVKVNEKWWRNPYMFDAWKPYLKRVGYEGGVLKFQ